MKKIIILSLLLVSVTSYTQTTKPEIVLGEKDKLIYLDSARAETTNSNYKYYRIIKDYKLSKTSYQVRDYYKSGVLQMESTSKLKDKLVKEGKMTSYYENGNKKNSSNYSDGTKLGEELRWYENGTPKLIGEYVTQEDEDGEKTTLKVMQYWNKEGEQKVVDGNGGYEVSGKRSFQSGKMKDGFKDGVWKGNFCSKKDSTKCGSYVESYENRMLVSGVSIGLDGKTYNYQKLRELPEPKFGIEHFYKYIGKNFKISEGMRKNGVNGKIYVQFFVEKSGDVKKVRILRGLGGLGYDADEEVVRVIQDYGYWIPGKKRGIPSRLFLVIPISIEH